MSRAAATLFSALFLVLAPGTVAGLVPWWISRWRFRPAFPGHFPLQIAGVLLITVTLPVLLDSFARFALEGFGTPAPVLPTRRLIVTGLYRYVRNPMYVAVFSIILGQALLFGNVRVLEYAALVWMAFHLFVLLYEEPAMRRTFPQEYAVFCKNVPRWIPRLTPWRGDRSTSSGSSDPNSTAPPRR
jgi:protein-S-isoprenylcysteine O-methyltransferase Ste14